MSSGGKKTVKINPNLFSVSGKTKKRGKKSSARKKREKPSNHSKTSKKMRKEFFSKIRAFQDKRRRENTSVSEKKDQEKQANKFDKGFNESLQFLSEYVSNNKKKKERKKRKTLKKEKSQLQISLDMPDNLSNGGSSVSSDSSGPTIIKDTPQVKVSVNNKPSIAPRPLYSSMKNGSRPTYRQWLAQTQKKQAGSSSGKITIDNKPEAKGQDRSQRLADIKSKLFNKDGGKAKKKKRVMKIKKSTKTIKRKLGKKDGKVAVLIKSRETRKRVNEDKTKLKQVSIITIKKYLKDKNLIRAGSKAPNDVLRKMYEQAILAGDLTNKSDGVLLHNYISNE